MLTTNHIKEGLSVAYIHAVATRAGFSCSARPVDYGIDGSINEIQVRATDGRRYETGFGIDYQAKASENCLIGSAHVQYDLEVKTHIDLVEPTRGRPLILILMALPKDPAKWLQLSHRRLLLRRCAWWIHLRGQTPSGNKQTVRVSIPRTNVFDVATLTNMMHVVRTGGLP